MKIFTKCLAIIICLFIILLFVNINKKEVKYVKSDIDNNKYIVRDLEDCQKAANMLARLKININILTEHLYENRFNKYIKFKDYINQLKTNIQHVEISESSEDSIYTSYSVNKGEEIVFCLRSKENKNKLHNLNLVMYVALHEISHVACPETGHTDLFKKIFAFFTQIAINQNLYYKIPFRNKPIEYCGLIITESII